MNKIAIFSVTKLIFALSFLIAFSAMPFTVSEVTAFTLTSERREGIPPRRIQGGTRILPKLPHQLITDQH